MSRPEDPVAPAAGAYTATGNSCNKRNEFSLNQHRFPRVVTKNSYHSCRDLPFRDIDPVETPTLLSSPLAITPPPPLSHYRPPYTVYHPSSHN